MHSCVFVFCVGVCCASVWTLSRFNSTELNAFHTLRGSVSSGAVQSAQMFSSLIFEKKEKIKCLLETWLFYERDSRPKCPDCDRGFVEPDSVDICVLKKTLLCLKTDYQCEITKAEHLLLELKARYVAFCVKCIISVRYRCSHLFLWEKV